MNLNRSNILLDTALRLSPFCFLLLFLPLSGANYVSPAAAAAAAAAAASNGVGAQGAHWASVFGTPLRNGFNNHGFGVTNSFGHLINNNINNNNIKKTHVRLFRTNTTHWGNSYFYHA